jgi:hypothetical protein
VPNATYFALIASFDRGELNVCSGRADGTNRRLGRDAGGRVYGVETNETVLPHTVVHHGGVGAGQGMVAENDFTRRSEELSRKGWNHVDWAYNNGVSEGILFEKDGEERILYFHKDSKDGGDGVDLRTVASKRNPCENRCGKEGGRRCICLKVKYCSQECQRAHWKEHKLLCV